MPVEVEAHTVPHFKGPVNDKLESFIIQASLLMICRLLHKSGFVESQLYLL